jgi:putative ABC transport system permease protein
MKIRWIRRSVSDNQYDAKVTGIYKAFPSNAHMHPQMLVSFNTLKDSAIYGAENLRTNWGNNSFFTLLTECLIIFLLKI